MAPDASTTSSGFCDGLGRRVLAFDREDGTMLERLLVRPDLVAFERVLRERVERVAALEDERLARPRSVEREPNGGLAVVSEFVPGWRLADLLETSAETENAPGIDAALGYLLDVLPALCGLHAGTGFAHGTIGPSRSVITPAGQVVLLDVVFGGALAHLRYSRQRLWTEFGVATPSTAGGSRLGVDADIAQVALSGILLVAGRPLGPHDFPDALAPLLREVGDVARIRAGESFADLWLHFLHRALVLPGSRPYPTADDALIELRELAEMIGAPGCRRALVDFVEQMEGVRQPAASAGLPGAVAVLDAFGMEGSDEDAEDTAVHAEASRSSLALEAELDLDGLGAAETDIDPFSPIEFEADPPADGTLLEDLTGTDPAAELTGAGWPSAGSDEEAAGRGTFPAIEAAAPPRQAPFAALGTQSQEPADVEPPSPSAGPEAPTSVRARRAKRTRSTRGRKDRLRSAADTRGRQEGRERVPGAAPPAAGQNWLVPPDRAASFSPPVAAPPEPPPANPTPVSPPPPLAASEPSDHLAAPRPEVPAPPPWQPGPAGFALPGARTEAAGLPLSSFPEPAAQPLVGGVEQVWTGSPAASPQPAAPGIATLKLKEPSQPAKRRERAPVPVEMDALPPREPAAERPPVPWKAVAATAATIILVVMGVVGGRTYLSGPSHKGPGEVAPAAAGARPAAATLPAAGSLDIDTQPAGAQVLLDGKPVGESPLTLDSVAPGRHTVTVVSPAGTVKRTVRVEAGRTAKLDIPIFSGWIGIYAPFVVEIGEHGRRIGTNEESRLMLSPGQHVLTFTNRDLNYSSQQTVDIEPGKLVSITLDPRGRANLNASPWAEVWIDGNRIGDTPIANHSLPLGIREVVFRHPDLGERRAMVTIKADGPAVVSVDLTRP